MSFLETSTSFFDLGLLAGGAVVAATATKLFSPRMDTVPCAEKHPSIKEIVAGACALCIAAIAPSEIDSTASSAFKNHATSSVAIDSIKEVAPISVKSDIEEHFEYLRRLSVEGETPPISRETAALSRKAWQQLWEESMYKLPVPAACSGPDGQMFYSWDKGDHHLELEIIPGEQGEFFYQNRKTGDFFGEDFTIGSQLPTEVLRKLKLFV